MFWYAAAYDNEVYYILKTIKAMRQVGSMIAAKLYMTFEKPIAELSLLKYRCLAQLILEQRAK